MKEWSCSERNQEPTEGGSSNRNLPVERVELLGADRGRLLKEELRVERVELLGEESRDDGEGSLKEEV